jgi:uncharacterized protein (DUF58 family)
MALPRLRRRALALCGGSLLIFAVGTNVQAGWLFVIASLILAVGVAGWALPARMVRGVAAERRPPAFAFQGDDVPVDLLVTGDLRHARLSLAIRDPFLAPTTVFVPYLDRGEQVTVATVRKAARRGPVDAEPLELSSSGPFGVATARRVISAGGRTLVYPRVVPLRWFPGVESSIEQGLPASSAHRRGSGQDYLGIREYRPGDSPRHVHWPSSARHGSLMVREFEQERPHHLTILIDTSADEGTEHTPLDVCCSVAASVALFAAGQGQPVDLCAGQERRLEVLAEPDPTLLLQWLAHLRPEGGLSLVEATQEASHRLGPDRTGVVVFPTWASNDGRAAAQALGSLASGSRAPVAVIVDAGSVGDGDDAHDRERQRWRPAGPDVLPDAQVEDLVAELSGTARSVFLVQGGLDLGECLRRPVGPGR